MDTPNAQVLTPDQAPARGRASRRRRRILAGLLGFALGVVLALSLSPRSEWLVRMQIAGLTPSDDMSVLSSLPSDASARLQRAAAALPGDPEAQCAWLAWRFPDSDKDSAGATAAASALVGRFPGDRRVMAAALRVIASGKDTAPALELAARGERQDPGNAFFPTVRAMLLFRDHLEKAAVAALATAAACRRWDEYLVEEVRGGWRLTDAAFGRGSVPPRVQMMYAATGSLYAVFANAVNAAAATAARYEAAGRLSDGYRIRHHMMRLGAQMRSHSTTMVGSLIGSMLQRTAMQDLANKTPDRLKGLRPLTAEEETAFEVFLVRLGHADEVTWVHEQVAAEARLRTILSAGGQGAGLDSGLRSFTKWVGIGHILLLAGFWLAVAGLVAAALARWRRGAVAFAWTRGFSAAVIPIACITLILYGAASLQTLSVASRINKDLVDMVRHEGRFYASRAGQEWPR
jgi:hypothetical protein